jgi:hypothetical protein
MNQMIWKKFEINLGAYIRIRRSKSVIIIYYGINIFVKDAQDF